MTGSIDPDLFRSADESAYVVHDLSQTPQTPSFLSADDLDLLSQRFQIDEPDKLPGLVETLPDDWASAAIEFEYELDPKKRVRCAHPGRHPHRKGVVLRLSDQRRFLVGWRCGEKFHDLDLKALRLGWDAKKDRGAFLNILVRSMPHLSDAMSDVRAMIESAPCSQFDRLRSELRTFSETGFQKLLTAVQLNGGMLSKIERRRDAAKEQKRDEEDEARIADILARTKGLPPARTALAQAKAAAEIKAIRENKEPIITRVSVDIGLLSGASLVQGLSPRAELAQAQTDFRSLFSSFPTLSQQPTKELRRMTKLIRDTIERAKKARATLIDIQSFYRQENLRRVAAAIGAELHGRELQTDERTLYLPTALQVPPVDGLLRLEQALTG